MKEGVKVEPHTFCISLMDEGERLSYVPTALPSRKTSTSERDRKRDVMHSRVNETTKKILSAPWGGWKAGNLARPLYRLICKGQS